MSIIETGPVPIEEPASGLTDGWGMRVHLLPGQGTFLLGNEAVGLSDPSIEISVSTNCSNDAVELGLIAIADLQDGNYGYINPTKSEIPVQQWEQIRLAYDSPALSIVPALQVVLPENAEVSSATVYFDRLEIKPLKILYKNPITMKVDTTFDTVNESLDGINPNAYLPQETAVGDVSLTDGMNGKGIQLQITPDQLAARIVMESNMPGTARDDTRRILHQPERRRKWEPSFCHYGWRAKYRLFTQNEPPSN